MMALRCAALQEIWSPHIPQNYKPADACSADDNEQLTHMDGDKSGYGESNYSASVLMDYTELSYM